MTIINKILSLFNQKATNNNIVNIADLYYIPKVEEINNAELKAMVKAYIDEYNIILKDKKNFSSLDLYNKSLKDKIEMYTNIILNICIDDDLKAEHIILPKIYVIICAKLKYYANSILENKKEIFARLIAIQYLMSKKLVSLSKRRGLKILYNSLIIAFNITQSQDYAITNIITNYLQKIKLVAAETDLIKYQARIYEIASNLIPNDFNNIINADIQETSKIVMLEIMLEQYVYNNQEELKKIDYLQLENKNVNEKEELLNKWQITLRALLNYGPRTIISKEELIIFYEHKFSFLCEVVTEDNINKYFELSKLGTLEFTTYEKIIQKIIDNFVKGHSKALINLPNNIKLGIIKQIKKIFALNGTFEVANILNNYTLFNLLVLLEKEDGIKEFFANYKINTSALKPELKIKSIVIIEDFISLECVRFLNRLLTNSDENNAFVEDLTDINKLHTNIYNLYLFWTQYQKSNKPTNFYQIPQGIIKLNLSSNKRYPFIDELKQKEKLLLPLGLKIFSCDRVTSNIILNKDLQYLDSTDWDSDTLEIMPSLKNIFIKHPKNIKIIIFNDFENSKLIQLHFFSFLRQFYEYEVYGREFENYIFYTTINKMIFENSMGETYTLSKDLLRRYAKAESHYKYYEDCLPAVPWRSAFIDVIYQILTTIQKDIGHELNYKRDYFERPPICRG